MMAFRRAEAADAAAIAALVNVAFSGDGGRSGWTHDADLFDGERTDRAEIQELLADPRVVFLVCVVSGAIAGCAYVKARDSTAFLGMLAVSPAQQARGVGKRLITESERVARDELGCTAVEITVVTTHRPELAAFYERRGYARSGRFGPLQRKGAAEKAKVAGLRNEWMTKNLGG